MSGLTEGAARPSFEDIVQPFQIEASHLRGRMVRLGDTLDEILSRHSYPEPVASLLGEMVLLAAILASALKYEGVFTLQVKGDAAVPLLVVDVTSEGGVRGYAKVREDRLAGLETYDVPTLIGRGHLAFTVMQGGSGERYQGIVELSGETLSECVRFYFRQSEQIDAGIKVAVGREDGAWRAGGVMIQRLPDPDQRTAIPSDREDDWRRAMVLMDSASPEELMGGSLSPNDVLYRLFHEDGVRVFQPMPLRPQCRCSRGRVEQTLRGLPRDEVEDLKVDGRLEVVCEFCGTRYDFDDADIATAYAS